MVATDRTFAGVMRKAAELCATIERADRVGGQRAEAHRRNIQQRGLVRLRAALTADCDAKVDIGDRMRSHRMVDPFIALAVDILLGTERALVLVALGALIDKERKGVVEGKSV